jgi:hypothetical protein
MTVACLVSILVTVFALPKALEHRKSVHGTATAAVAK